MARIRTVKPDIWTSEQFTDCSPLARLLFIGLLNFTDDNGIHPASTRRLKMEVFPADEISNQTMRELIEELIDNELVEQYTTQSETYWRVIKFSKHQRIRKPTYKYPLPGQRPENSGTSTEPVPDLFRTGTEPVPDQSGPEGNGMEGNGMEGNGDTSRDDFSDDDDSNGQDPVDDTDTMAARVRAVFEHWQEVMGKRRAILDSKRTYAISQRLKNGFTVDDLKRAIEGCHRSDFHMARDGRSGGRMHNDIELICRNAPNVERFMEYAEGKLTTTMPPTEWAKKNNIEAYPGETPGQFEARLRLLMEAGT